MQIFSYLFASLLVPERPGTCTICLRDAFVFVNRNGRSACLGCAHLLTASTLQPEVAVHV